MRHLSTIIIVICFASFLPVLNQCTTHTQGAYADPDKAEIVGEKWNETDAKKVAHEATTKCLASPWIADYKREKNGKKPIVIVAHISNKTSEHIDTKSISNEIRNSLINSRQVRFLANEQRDIILKEYQYQKSGAVRADQAKGPGNQFGADYLLGGDLSAIVSQDGDYKTVTYQVDLQLTNLSTSEYEWSFQKKIKKQFKRNSVTW